MGDWKKSGKACPKCGNRTVCVKTETAYDEMGPFSTRRWKCASCGYAGSDLESRFPRQNYRKGRESMWAP